jgi:DNA-binding beta-propeller fold protein YncE
MAMEHAGHLDLPAHIKPGGFDHAAVHSGLGRLYVAHTANDALDVIDCRAGRCVGSIPGLAGVAGALVSEEQDLVFTSNRGENTIGVFSPLHEQALVKVTVGLRPNGLAFDPVRGLLLAANVGDAAAPESFTLSIVDVEKKAMIVGVPVPGRTRWAVFDRECGAFYVNIADPPQIAVIESRDPRRVARAFPIPAGGPHGLDLDPKTHRLFCACDAGQVIAVDVRSGKILGQAQICGSPDVILFNPALNHLYVAIGDPGVIEVLDTEMLRRVEVVHTERGTHTMAFDPARNRVFAFLPGTHRAAIYVDRTEGLSESEAGTKLAPAP